MQKLLRKLKANRGRKRRSIAAAVLAAGVNLVFTVSVCCSSTSLQAPAGRLRLSFGDPATGCRLLEVYDTRAGRNVIVSNANLWSVELRHSTGVTITVGSGECIANITSSPVDATIDWELGLALEAKMSEQLKQDGDQQGRRQIRAVCTVVVTESGAEMHLSIDNPSIMWSLTQINFPYTYLARLGEDANDDNLMTPMACGRLNRKPLINGVQCSHWGWNVPYPSAEGPFQAYAYWDAAGGLYISPQDPCGARKYLWAYAPAGGNSIEIKTTWLPENSYSPGNDFSEPGKFKIALFDGDWYDAAQIYRKWVFEKAGWRVDEDSRRPDTPQWMKDNCVWVRAWGSPEEVVGPTLDFANYMTVPIALHWYMWHQIPFDQNYPHYFPARPGFAEAVAQLQAAGIRVMPYINGRVWDEGLDDFNTIALPATAKDANGHYYTEDYGSGHKLVPMCPATSLWQNKVREIVLRLLSTEFSVDGVYIDQIAAMQPAACFDSSHGHSLGDGHWWVTDGYRPMLSQLLNTMAAQFPDTILASESKAEPYLNLFDGYLTWDQEYQNQVPFFPAVYGGSIQLFGRDMMGTDQAAHCIRIAQSLVFGEQLGWVDPSFIQQTQAAAFLRDAAKVRQKLLPFLSWGTMARPPMVSGNIPDVNSNWAWNVYSYWPVTESALQRGAWQAKDGRIAFIFANGSSGSMSFTWHFEPNNYELSDRRVWIEPLENPAQGEFGEGPFDKGLNLAGRDIVVYIVQATMDKADFDQDKDVDFQDFAAFARDFALANSGKAGQADLDGDGDVDLADIAVLAYEWLAGTAPPEPNPMSWARFPAALGNVAIDMMAMTATYDYGVEYYFNNMTDSNHDSGWLPSRYFVDSGLEANSTYSYRAKARDSYRRKETAYSSIQSATTLRRLGPNLLTNPDFETNNWYWDFWQNNVYQGGVPRVSGDSHGGMYSAKVSGSNERTQHCGNGVTGLNPSKVYQVQIWVKVAGFQTGEAPFIECVGPGGVYLWSHTFDGNTSGWEKFAPAVTDVNRVYVLASYEDSNNSGGYLLIDDVTVCEVLP